MGVIDELSLHLVPVLLGAGVRLFALNRGPVPLALRPGVTNDGGVVHLWYGPA